jgi:hypothetical protein
MLNGEKIVVVMPTYNAARTLRQTYEEVMGHGIVDHVIVVDDASHDDTVAIARTLDRVQVEVHPVNRGYGANQTEYHTGYRAFARSLLEPLPLDTNSDDFAFDNQVLAQIIALGCAIGEVTCPARYLPEASSINFRRSVRYGLGCLATALRFRFARRLLRPIA